MVNCTTIKQNSLLLISLHTLSALVFSFLIASAQALSEDAASTSDPVNTMRWCELEEERLEKLQAQLAQRNKTARYLADLAKGHPTEFIDLNIIFGFDVKDDALVLRRISELETNTEVGIIGKEVNCTTLAPNFATVIEQLHEANKDFRQYSLAFLQIPPAQRKNFLLLSEIGVNVTQQKNQLQELQDDLLDHPGVMSEASLRYINASIAPLMIWADKQKSILLELAVMISQSFDTNNPSTQKEIEHFFKLMWDETFSLTEKIDLPTETFIGLSTTEQQFLQDMSVKLQRVYSQLWFDQSYIKLGVIAARKHWSQSAYHFSDLLGDSSVARRIESQALYFTLTYPVKAVSTFLQIDPSTPTEKATRIFQSIVNWFKTLVFLAMLLWLSKHIKDLLNHLQDRLLVRSNSVGGLRLLSVLMGAISPYFYVTTVFTLLTISSQFYWLNSTLPYWAGTRLLYLYLGYQLLSIVTESILIRLADNAGKFLSGTSLQQITQRSNRLSQHLLTLLTILVLIEASTGQGFFYHISLALTFIVFYLSVGIALSPQAEDIQLNLNAIIGQFPGTKTLEIKNKTILKSVAPIVLIPIVANNLMIQANNQLMLFAWYRKIFAHSLSLKNLTKKEGDATPEEESSTSENYDAWFSDKPLQNDLPYIPTGLLVALTERVNSWITSSTQTRTCIVTGEKGLGTSAALRKLTEQCEKGEIKTTSTYITLSEKITTVDQLQQLFVENNIRFDEQEDETATDIPRIIMIDDAHNLFLTQVGHLGAISRFLEIMRNSKSKIYWIIGINNLSWNYIRRAMPDVTFSLETIAVKHWTPAEIRSLILSRHHRSQFKLDYNKVALSATGRGDSHALRTAEQRFFYLLRDLCQGNPAIALRLWLKTVQVNPGRKVVASAPKKLATPEMASIPNSFLFVYASILIHNSMSKEELVQATNLDSGIVSSALKLASDKGFIKQEHSKYSFHLIHFQFINNYLQRKNMLHE